MSNTKFAFRNAAAIVVSSIIFASTFSSFAVETVVKDENAAQARVQKSIEKGIAFLLANQRPDGSFSDPQMPALTGLPMWAFVHAKDYLKNTSATADVSRAINKAVSFILKTQRPDGGFYVSKPGRGGFGLGNYNTSVCVSALYESGIAPVSAVLAARTYIASSQLTGDDSLAGGFGYDRASRRRYADLNNSVYAMDAMRRTQGAEESRPAGEARADLDWGKALEYVSHLQEFDGERAGGFAYNDRTPQGGTDTNKTGKVQLRAYGSMTYAGVLALVHANLTRADPRVRSALDYCSRNWTLDENPGMGSQGIYFYYDILSRSLSASGVDSIKRQDGSSVDWRAQLAEKIMALQGKDGSWTNSNNRFWESDPILVTSYCILALSACDSL